jgi:predicted GIY-YIG superfamily endonuclease
VPGAVHALRAEDQIGERLRKQRQRLIERPVVAWQRVHGRIVDAGLALVNQTTWKK